MKYEYAKTAGCIAILAALAGCVGTGGGTVTQMATAMTAFGGVTNANQAPTAEDLALSCKEINSRLSNLYARYEELDRQQKAEQRKQAMVNGVLDVGLGVLGGSAMSNAGSAQGLRNAGMALDVGGAAMRSVVTQENSASDLKKVNDTMAIAQRSAQLERAKVEKGC